MPSISRQYQPTQFRQFEKLTSCDANGTTKKLLDDAVTYCIATKDAMPYNNVEKKGF